MKYDEWINDFSKKLNSIMDERDMSQEELVSKIGVSQATVSRYLNAKQEPSLSSIVNMSKVLGCSIKELVKTDEYIDRRR